MRRSCAVCIQSTGCASGEACIVKPTFFTKMHVTGEVNANTG